MLRCLPPRRVSALPRSLLSALPRSTAGATRRFPHSPLSARAPPSWRGLSTLRRDDDADADADAEAGKSTAAEKSTAASRGRLSEARRLLALYAPEKKPLALSISALTVSTAITMCVPYGMGRVMDVVAAGGDLSAVVTALGALFAAGAAANVVRVDTSNMIGERITNRLRQSTYESILTQDLAFFDAARTGELVNRLSADTTLIGKVLSDNVSAGLRSGGQALGSISMLCYTCPQLALVMLSVVPPLAVGAVSYGRFVKKLTARVQTQLSAATEVAEEKLANVRVVRWFSKEDHEKRVHQRAVDEVLALARRRSLASASFFGSVDLAVKMSMLGVLGYGGQMVADGALTSGELTSFLLYTLYVGFSFAGMSSFYSEMMKGIGASTRVFELLDRRPRVRALDVWQPLPAGRRVVFEDVSFRYPTRPDAAVFQGLSLEIQPSETVALVGASGCGKSTLTALLARFYELDQEGCGGRILLDGVDVATLNPSELRGIMGAVPQEPPLFACSIRDNIAYGCQWEPTMAEVEAAARLANAHEFIAAFPDGYDTVVGERGLSLSGGQKQRVAIARALIKKPSILILDEATSALDPESERLVQDAVDRAKVGRTVILVAHRLSTIKTADRIAVIADGRVVEHGSFAQLAARSDSVFSQVVLHGQQ